jgi:carbonic anhydrase/acetyltransferase-like protein (isoleucine patch superfamily)
MIHLIRSALFKITGTINWFIFKLNKVKTAIPEIRGILLLRNSGGKLSFGKDCIINSSKYKNIIGGDTRSSMVVKKNAQLSAGANLRMSNSAIYCADKITIGDNVMIGGSCKIWDTDFHPLQPDVRTDNPNEGYKTKPINIGNNVFIGGFSIILKGTNIGDGSIIGAGSVVSGTIPPGEIWAGNPAKFIKKVS